MALETWWLTPISLMNGNVGPELRTDRRGVEKEDPPYAHLGASVSSPKGRCTQWLAAPLGSQDWAFTPSSSR